MRIVVNYASNLSDEIVAHYGNIEVTPQTITVDGQVLDTREIRSLEQVDEWVKTAKTYPFILGPSAGDFAKLFRGLIDQHGELLVLTTAKKVINTHSSVTNGVKTLQQLPKYRDARVEVIDSGSTDVFYGLATILVAEGQKAGLKLDELAALARAACAQGSTTCMFAELKYAVKGGRATFLRAWLAGILKMKPILGFKDSELTLLDKVQEGKEDPVAKLVDLAVQRHGEKRKVWVGVTHGNNLQGAQDLVRLLKQRLDVQGVYLRSIHPSIYLYSGPGSLALGVIPIDKLPWQPTRPTFL